MLIKRRGNLTQRNEYLIVEFKVVYHSSRVLTTCNVVNLNNNIPHVVASPLKLTKSLKFLFTKTPLWAEFTIPVLHIRKQEGLNHLFQLKVPKRVRTKIQTLIFSINVQSPAHLAVASSTWGRDCLEKEGILPI